MILRSKSFSVAKFVRLPALAALALVIGVTAALQLQPASSVSAQAAGEMTKVCNPDFLSVTAGRAATASDVKACEVGYQGSGSGKSIGDTCKGQTNGNNKLFCELGFNTQQKQAGAGVALSEAQLRDKAEAACKTGSDDQKSACRNGFREGYNNNKTLAGTCGNQRQTAYTSDAEKSACEKGFEQGQKLLEDRGGFPKKTNSDESPSCETFGSSPLGWIICPLIEAGTAFTDYVYKGLVEPLLSNNPLDSNSDSSTYKAWQGFRLIANLILVASMLILVFAQTTGRGSGMISAYAVKKMAPRILFAAIAINLSIYLVVATVDITNIIGKGLGQLLREPFIQADTFSGIKLENNFESIGTASLVGVVGGGLLAILFGSIFGGVTVAAGLATLGGGLLLLLLLFMITIGAVSLAVVVTVVIRYGLILFLGLVSPIAIACFILPGTEKYFRSWWSLFSKTLIVYPIIATIFAMSDIMASIFLNMQSSDSVNDVAGVTAVFIALFAVYAPLFLIPFAFKLAGGVMATLFDFSRKGTGWLDNKLLGDPKDPDSFRGKLQRDTASKFAQNDLSMKAISSRLTNTGRVRGGDNSREARSRRRNADLAAIREGYKGKYSREAAQSIFAQAGAQTDEVQMDLARYATGAESLAAISNGSHISMRSQVDAVAGERYDGKRFADLDDNQKAAVLNSGDQRITNRAEQLRMYSALNERTGRTQATRSAAAKSQAALSYGYANGKEGWDDAVAIAESIHGKDNTAEVLSHLNELQYVGKQVGRSDLAGNVNSTKYDLDRATGSMSTYQLLNGKPQAVAGFIDMHLERLRTGDGTPEDLRKSAIFLNEMASAQTKGQGTGAIRDAINLRMKDMNTESERYIQDETARQQNLRFQDPKQGLAPERREDTVTRQVAHPDPVRAAAGDTVAVPTKVERAVSIEEQVREEIQRQSRAYNPPDPSNLQDKGNEQQQNKPGG